MLAIYLCSAATLWFILGVTRVFGKVYEITLLLNFFWKKLGEEIRKEISFCTEKNKLFVKENKKQKLFVEALHRNLWEISNM